MRKIIPHTFFVFAALLFALRSQAQVPPAWSWNNGVYSGVDEYANDIAIDTTTGNVVVAGIFNSDLSAFYGPGFFAAFGGGFVARYDANGNVLWAFPVGNNQDDGCSGVTIDSAGNIYVTGFVQNVADVKGTLAGAPVYVSSAGGKDMFIAKYNSAGQLLWARSGGGMADDEGYAVAVSPAGVFVTGYYQGAAAFGAFSITGSMMNSAVYVAGYDGVTGNELWVTTAGDAGTDAYGRGICADNNAVFVTGDFVGSTLDVTDSSGAVITLASAGATLNDIFVWSLRGGMNNWVQAVQSPGMDMGHDVAQLGNNIYIGGATGPNASFPSYSGNPVNPGANGLDMFVAQLQKTTGNANWVQFATGPSNQDAMSLTVTKRNRVYAAGYLFSSMLFPGGVNINSAGAQDAFVAAYDTLGNFQWANWGGEQKSDYALGVAANDNNEVYIAGAYTEDAVFFPYTLNRADGSSLNILTEKIGCTAITTNAVSAPQTICPGQTPLPLSGSLPTGGMPMYNYFWQQSTDNVNWTAATGVNTNKNYAPPSLSVNTYYRRVVSGGCPGTDTSAGLLITIAAPSTPANAGADSVICAGSVNLWGNAPTIGTGTWTLVSGGGNIVSAGSSTTAVTGLAPGIHIFAWTISNSGCSPTSDTVSVSVGSPPSVALAGSDQHVCASTYTLNASPPVNGTGAWLVLAGSATVTSSAPNSTVTGLSNGPNIFVWTISNNCGTSRDTVVITRDALPGVANAGINQTICASAYTLNANVPSTGSGQWNVLAGGASVANPFQNNSAASGLTVGLNSFEWVVSSGVCPASKDTVTIQVDANPTVANAGANQAICASSYTLNANAPVTGSGQWSVLTGGSTVTTLSLHNSPVNNLSTGANTLIWTISNGVCPSSKDTVTITVDAMPSAASAGNPQIICNDSAVLSAAVPAVGTGSWSVVSGGGSVTNASQNNTIAFNLSTGNNVFMWSVFSGVCPASTSTVSVQVDAAPSAAYAGNNTSICNSTYTLNATVPAIGTGSWTLVSGGGSITNPSFGNTVVNGLSIGQNIFQWEVQNGTCPSNKDSVIITVDANPSVANAGNPQIVCALSSTLTAVPPVIGIGMWHLVAGGSTITAPTISSTGVINLSVGINVFEWVISNGSCPPSRDTVYITVDANPTVANAGSDQLICTNTATLSANVPSVGTGSWSVIACPATVTLPGSSSTSANNLMVGQNQFVWTISNGVCPSSADTVKITVSQQPSAASAGADVNVCVNSSQVVLNAVSPQVGAGMWTQISGAGTLSNSNQSNPTVSGLSLGQNVFVWTVSNSVCVPSSDTVSVIVYPNPTPANAGADFSVSGTSANVNGNTPVVGNGYWALVSGSGNVVSPSSAYTQVTGLNIGDNVFGWTISNGVCPDSYDEVVVHVNDLEVPNGFSPNGDMVNDFFEIPALDLFGDVKLEVFNRWGNLVYESENYKNDWDGKNRSGEDLTDDTYYYTLVVTGKKTYKGFVVLKRK